MFSLGQDAASPSNTDVYYMKGAPGNDHTTCDSSFTFYTENDSLYLAPYPLTDSTMANGVCNFTLSVVTPTFTANSICYYCAACQRTGQHSDAKPEPKEEAVRLYPNPGNGHITMAFSFAAAKNIEIEVLNATGVQVYKTTQSRVDKASFDYDLSFLAKGIYFVHITDDTDTKVVKKIMIE